MSRILYPLFLSLLFCIHSLFCYREGTHEVRVPDAVQKDWRAEGGMKCSHRRILLKIAGFAQLSGFSALKSLLLPRFQEIFCLFTSVSDDDLEIHDHSTRNLDDLLSRNRSSFVSLHKLFNFVLDENQF